MVVICCTTIPLIPRPQLKAMLFVKYGTSYPRSLYNIHFISLHPFSQGSSTPSPWLPATGLQKCQRANLCTCPICASGGHTSPPLVQMELCVCSSGPGIGVTCITWSCAMALQAMSATCVLCSGRLPDCTPTLHEVVPSQEVQKHDACI